MKYFCCLVLFHLFIFSAKGQNTIEVLAEQDELRLYEQMEFYEDTTQQETINTIQNKPFKKAGKVLNAGITASSFWFRVALKSPKSLKRLVCLANADVGEVKMYEIGAGDKPKLTEIGTERPFYQRPFLHRYYVFPIEIIPETKIYYFKVDFIGTATYPFLLQNEYAFLRQDHQEQLIIGIFYGLCLIMSVYNGFLFFYLNDKAYLFYTWGVITTGIVYAQTRGFMFEYVWQEWFSWNQIAMKYIVPIGMMSNLFFFMVFLQTKKLLPFWHKILYVLFFAYCVEIIATMIFGKEMSDNWNSVVATPHMILQLVIPIIAFRKGYKPAIYLLLAQSCFLVGSFSALFRTAGILEANIFTDYAFVWGSSFEIALFSLGLAYRINLMREELKQKELEQARIRQEEEAKRIMLIKQQNKELEGKVQERTTELVQKNEEIQQQHEELKVTTEKIQQQHELLEEVFGDLQDSINYAQRIQNAILPKTKHLNNLLSEHFIYYLPRDVVSGDFYWATEVAIRKVNPEQEIISGFKKQIFIVADCTGHGVPGAFMSMIGINILNQIVVDKKIDQPHLILWALDTALRFLLKKDDSENQDGMDAAVVSIDKESNILEFSGAKRPIIYFQNGEMTEIKGTVKSIGGHEREKEKFEKHTVSTQNMTFYLFSDGYCDQIGGHENRKYMIKRFRELLTNIQDKSLVEQRQIIENTHIAWKGTEKQIDDILVAGFRA